MRKLKNTAEVGDIVTFKQRFAVETISWFLHVKEPTGKAMNIIIGTFIINQNIIDCS